MNKQTRKHLFKLFLISCLILIEAAGLWSQKTSTRPLRAGDESRGPWWMKATALNTEGRLPSLRTRKWWKKSLELKPGESLIPEESGEARGRLAVRVESYELDGGEKVEVLVMIIDDDADGSLKAGGDYHDDCYLYDLNRDGWVDLMVDYADEDGDGQADFMEVRYFERGYLTRAWFGYDFDGTGEMIKFRNPVELMAEVFSFNLAGRKLYFKNVYARENRSWRPAEVSHLASFDFDGDGLSDMVVRANLSRDKTEPVIASLEISHDVDRSSTLARPFHYDLGLVLELRLPFDLNKFRIFSPKRRPPQEAFAVPFDEVKDLIKEAEPGSTGFSWREYPDENLEKNLEWKQLEGQGIGWIQERHWLSSAVPVVQKWNVRREIATAEGPVEFYYSEGDFRLHLFRAEEGWLPAGNLAGLPRLLEIRYFDSDRNGYFDRREVYLVNSTRPVLVLPLNQDGIKKIPFDLNLISEIYLKEALPKRVAVVEAFLGAMKKIYSYEQPPELNSALEKATPGERVFLQEIYCLLYFINLRDHFLTMANQVLFQELSVGPDRLPAGDLHPRVLTDPRQVFQPLKSDRAWELARLLTCLEEAFGQNQLEVFQKTVERIKALGF